MRHHRHRAVKFLFHVVHHGVRFVVHKNHAFKEIAIQQRLNRQCADDDRRNRQKHQRKRYHPRAFVRIIVGRQAVMMFVAMMRIVLGFAPTFFAMEHDKVLAERIKRGNNTLANTAK